MSVSGGHYIVLVDIISKLIIRFCSLVTILLLYITKPAPADYTRNNLLILRHLFSAALYIGEKNYPIFTIGKKYSLRCFLWCLHFEITLSLIYNTAENKCRKINKLFSVKPAGAGFVIY